ncbi:MAG: hypothetical protein IKW71_02615, partial [Elusimicrobiaceae bacterium]|nr:hypothetical protein [Elusimicrobiaceae bacterium]
EAEGKLRQQQLQDNMRQALELYNKGQYVEAYAVFERIKKIQPGDARVQKYMSQLKNEIAGSYYTAGCQAFSSYQYDRAISYWNNAKKWGADSAAMDGMIKKARNAKEVYIRNQELRAKQLEQEAQQAELAAKQAADKAKQLTEQAAKKVEEQQEVLETITVDNQVPGVSTTVIPGALPGATTTPAGLPGMSEVVPGLSGGGITRVSAEASAASRAKYIEGLDAYNQDDFERARQAWIVAKQLDPGNTDAELGLRKVEELMMIK